MIFKEKDPAEVEAALKAMVSIAYVCFNYTYIIYRFLFQLAELIVWLLTISRCYTNLMCSSVNVDSTNHIRYRQRLVFPLV